MSRVAERVRLGGHDVPEVTVRRRYERGLRNFFAIYRSQADVWQMFDNSPSGSPALLATGRGAVTDVIVEPSVWKTIEEQARATT